MTYEERPKTEEERYKELEDMVEKKKKEDVFSWNDVLLAFDDLVRKSGVREEAKLTRLYHLLIKSGRPPEYFSGFDLPDGRIEKFIREEL